MITAEEYRDKVLQVMRDFEKQFDPVDQYEVTNALAELYETIRALSLKGLFK